MSCCTELNLSEPDTEGEKKYVGLEDLCLSVSLCPSESF